MFFSALILVVVGQLVSADLQQLLELSSASVDFSQNLYKKIALDVPSIVYSPYSIHSALSMTSLGAARGVTLTQMIETLGVKAMGSSLHTSYEELIEQYNSETNVHIHTGNALFINRRYAIVPKFIEDTKEYYFAKADNIDMFANGGPEKPINDYIANKTENMITDMLAPGSIDGLTVMLLVNALYFNGVWKSDFNIRSTRSQNFYQLGGAVVKVDMMHDDRSIFMKRDNANGVDVAELPFRGGRYSMYIALPQQEDGITHLESLLANHDKVNNLFTGLNSIHTRLAIPKFRIESSIDLKSALNDMGIVDAFISGQADFTGITHIGGSFISQVLHKAVLEVRESGTVAAAPTTVEVQFKSIPTETFLADHPFLFFLRDNDTKQILFQGKFSG